MDFLIFCHHHHHQQQQSEAIQEVLNDAGFNNDGKNYRRYAQRLSASTTPVTKVGTREQQDAIASTIK